MTEHIEEARLELTEDHLQRLAEKMMLGMGWKAGDALGFHSGERENHASGSISAMTEDVTKLVERLRKLVIMDEVGSDNPLGREAASALLKVAEELANADLRLYAASKVALELSDKLTASEASASSLREALKPFAGVLVYSFEDDPGSIYVTYAGQTLAVLDLDSEQGSAALKLEQELAVVRTLIQGDTNAG